MAQTLNNQADPKEVKNARTVWLGFTKLIRYGSVAVAIILLLMLLFIY